MEEVSNDCISIQDPMKVIWKLFDQHQSLVGADNSYHSDWGVKQTFDAFFKANPNELNKVPYLTSEKLRNGILPPNSLVRYVGMIQDIFDLEFYAGIYEEVDQISGFRKLATCKYMDSVPSKVGVQADFEGPNAKTLDRLPVYCTSIPGLSSWAKVSQEGQSINSTAITTKGTSNNKRHLDGENTDPMEEDTVMKTVINEESDGGEPSSKKKQETDSYHEGNAENVHQFVEGSKDDDHLDCLVKVYDDATNNAFRLNEAVEFLGVLSIDPTLPLQPLNQAAENRTNGPTFPTAMDAEMETEFAARNPPTSTVPRLHCISYRKLPCHWPIEVRNAGDPLMPLVKAPHTYSGSIQQIRLSLLHHLTQTFQGDILAAEYCLLALISTVHTRLDDLALGVLSVNLSNADSTDVASVQQALQQLYPKICTVEIGMSILNSGILLPKKDYERNRLCACPLQLSSDTALILDETQMQEGQLNPLGLKSVEALKLLISQQKMPYDFQFYQMQYEVNHPVLVFSVNKGLTKASCHFKWNKNENSSQQSHQQTDQESLERWRYFLAGAKSLNSKFSIDEGISKLAENHFVVTRRRNPETKPEDFHRWLTLARLITLSYGETAMTREHWLHALELEKSANSRLVPSGVNGNNMNPASFLIQSSALLNNDTVGRNSPSSVMTDINQDESR